MSISSFVILFSSAAVVGLISAESDCEANEQWVPQSGLTELVCDSGPTLELVGKQTQDGTCKCADNTYRYSNGSCLTLKECGYPYARNPCSPNETMIFGVSFEKLCYYSSTRKVFLDGPRMIHCNCPEGYVRASSNECIFKHECGKTLKTLKTTTATTAKPTSTTTKPTPTTTNLTKETPTATKPNTMTTQETTTTTQPTTTTTKSTTTTTQPTTTTTQPTTTTTQPTTTTTKTTTTTTQPTTTTTKPTTTTTKTTTTTTKTTTTTTKHSTTTTKPTPMTTTTKPTKTATMTEPTITTTQSVEANVAKTTRNKKLAYIFGGVALGALVVLIALLITLCCLCKAHRDRVAQLRADDA